MQNPRVKEERNHADPSRAGRPVLGSERLRLEPVVPAHVELFVTLNSDPEVMRFILGRGASEAETRQEWLQRMGPQTDAARGLGYWSGFTVGGTFLGWWSASAFREDDRRAGLGYRLVRSSWGLGYATEGARLMLEQAGHAPSVEKVVASTMAVHLRSRRVLEKLGMTHVDTAYEQWPDPLPGSEEGEVIYEICVRER